MTDRVNQQKWKIQHSRVYGDGKSYNCTNRVTAKDLHQTLNNYETEIQNLNKQNKTNHNIDAINKQIKQILMDVEILRHDIETLKNKLEV